MCLRSCGGSETPRSLSANRISYAGSIYEAAEGADALLILTDWEEFTRANYSLIRDLLHYPIVINRTKPSLSR